MSTWSTWENWLLDKLAFLQNLNSTWYSDITNVSRFEKTEIYNLNNELLSLKNALDALDASNPLKQFVQALNAHTIVDVNDNRAQLISAIAAVTRAIELRRFNAACRISKAADTFIFKLRDSLRAQIDETLLNPLTTRNSRLLIQLIERVANIGVSIDIDTFVNQVSGGRCEGIPSEYLHLNIAGISLEDAISNALLEGDISITNFTYPTTNTAQNGTLITVNPPGNMFKLFDHFIDPVTNQITQDVSKTKVNGLLYDSCILDLLDSFNDIANAKSFVLYDSAILNNLISEVEITRTTVPERTDTSVSSTAIDGGTASLTMKSNGVDVGTLSLEFSTSIVDTVITPMANGTFTLSVVIPPANTATQINGVVSGKLMNIGNGRTETITSKYVTTSETEKVVGSYGIMLMTRINQIANALAESNNTFSDLNVLINPNTGIGAKIYQYGLDQDEAGKIQRAMLVKSILNDASALKELLAEINNPTRILS